MPGLVELCTPHLVHALVIGAAESHGRSKPNVEIAKIFESAYQFLSIELGPLRCNAAINTLAST
jgi:hypothetical protein